MAFDVAWFKYRPVRPTPASLGATLPTPIAEVVFGLYEQRCAAHADRKHDDRWRSQDEDCEEGYQGKAEAEAGRASWR